MFSQAVIWRYIASSTAEVLGFGEALIDVAATREIHIGIVTWPQNAIVLGLYEALRNTDNDHENIYRRITGGYRFDVSKNDFYTIAVIGKPLSLHEAVERAKCITNDFGVTRIGDKTVIEAHLTTRPHHEEILSCLMGSNARITQRQVEMDKELVLHYTNRYKSPGWRFYRFHRGSGVAKRSKESFRFVVSVEVVDGYITGWWIDSTLYMAPPMELHSILASVRGSPFHELTLFNIELAIRKRLETYGLSRDEIIDAIRELYSVVGVRFYKQGPD